MNILGIVGRIDPVIETEINDGVPQQIKGVTVYINVGDAPMSRSGYIMLGPILHDDPLASLLSVGKKIVLNISSV